MGNCSEDSEELDSDWCVGSEARLITFWVDMKILLEIGPLVLCSIKNPSVLSIALILV